MVRPAAKAREFHESMAGKPSAYFRRFISVAKKGLLFIRDRKHLCYRFCKKFDKAIWLKHYRKNILSIRYLRICSFVSKPLETHTVKQGHGNSRAINNGTFSLLWKTFVNYCLLDEC